MLTYVKNKKEQLLNNKELSLYAKSDLKAVLGFYKDDF